MKNIRLLNRMGHTCMRSKGPTILEELEFENRNCTPQA